MQTKKQTKRPGMCLVCQRWSPLLGQRRDVAVYGRCSFRRDTTYWAEGCGRWCAIIPTKEG